jgi:hypothetical protein
MDTTTDDVEELVATAESADTDAGWWLRWSGDAEEEPATSMDQGCTKRIRTSRWRLDSARERGGVVDSRTRILTAESKSPQQVNFIRSSSPPNSEWLSPPQFLSPSPSLVHLVRRLGRKPKQGSNGEYEMVCDSAASCQIWPYKSWAAVVPLTRMVVLRGQFGRFELDYHLLVRQ